MVVAALVATALASGVRAESDDERKQACANPDQRSRVVGNKFCFAIRTYGTQTAGPAPTLVVVLHGDTSSGGPTSTQYRIAKAVATNGVVGVGLIRPGYYDSEERSSDGAANRTDNYTPENVDAIADAVKKLKDRHKAAHTVLIGHSGGAAISGVILGRHPGLVDRALLIACNCDVRRWRDEVRRSQWSSLSPSDHVAKVPTTAKVIAITGDKDDNSHPGLARDYVAALQARGIKAKFMTMPGAGHNITDRMRATAEYAQALKEIVAGNF
jgi:pimeloyl-ACP methyl ester carboxylesterase